MRREDAYAALGLRPGAGRAEIDQAYRRLIKRYHPDHAGGDASRAAELNRAYSELRALSRHELRPPPPPPPPRRAPRRAAAAMPPQLPDRRGVNWRALTFAIAGLAAAVVLARGVATWEPRSRFPSAATAAALAERGAIRPSDATLGLDQPLSVALIDGAVSDAMRLHSAGDPLAAAMFSRDCLARLSSSPSVPLFDSCAAYDEAIALLAVGTPKFDLGTFNPSAVTARQVDAARLLSADFLEATSRLQQIRGRVHFILLPQIPDSPSGTQQPFAATDIPQIAELAEPAEPIEPVVEPRPIVRPLRAETSERRVERRAAPQPRLRTVPRLAARRSRPATPAPGQPRQSGTSPWELPLPPGE